MPQMSLGNGYNIDLADGWTFVHALEDAVDEMRAGYVQNVQGLVIDPPGNDHHSETFSSSIGQKAVNAHEAWYAAKLAQLQGMIANVTGILQQYQIAETANTIQWSGPQTYNPSQDSDVPKGRHGAI